MKMEDNKIKTKNVALENYKKKYDTAQVDADTIKAKTQTMTDILKDTVKIPRPLRFITQMGQKSVRPVKTGENPLLTGTGEEGL